MELILQQDNVLGQFKTNWETYVKVILDYATFHKNPSKDLHHSLRDLHDDNNVWEESGGIDDVYVNRSIILQLNIIIIQLYRYWHNRCAIAVMFESAWIVSIYSK